MKHRLSVAGRERGELGYASCRPLMFVLGVFMSTVSKPSDSHKLEASVIDARNGSLLETPTHRLGDRHKAMGKER